MKRKSIDAVPIWFVSKKMKPEKCIIGDTLAPEKKALMITGDARGSQRVNKKAVAILPLTAIYPQRLFCRELFVIGQS